MNGSKNIAIIMLLTLALLAVTPSSASAEPNRDGVIESGEYENSKVFGDGHFEVHWTLDDDRIFMGLRAQTTGYLALGFEPTAMMADIDVVLGRVVEGDGEVMDGYSTSQFGPPTDDEAQGGSHDIESDDAEEVGGWTTVEFRRDLDTGDSLDHVIPSSGNMTIVWATGPTDDWTQRHTLSGQGTLGMGGTVEPPPGGNEMDGIIGDGEYPFMFTAAGGDFEVHWKVEGTTVQFGIRARTNGWVAIGLEPTNIMKDADMYFGWVQGGTPTAVDAWSSGTFGPHPKDTDQGGTHDITSYGATETGGWTTFELLRDLDTGDGKDRVVPSEGKIDIIWAAGQTDNWNEQHSMRGSATIDMGTGEAVVNEGFPRWSLHAILMTVGLVLMLFGFAIVRNKKKRKNWLDLHKKVMVVAGVLSGLGLVFGILMIIQSGGPHLRLPHTWIGAVTLVVAVVTVAMGYAYTKAPGKRKKKLRPIKIWMGRITVALMAATTMMGVLTVLLGL